MQPLSPIATLFVLVIGVLLPVAAWRSRRAFDPDRTGPPVTRARFYASGFTTQLLGLSLALLVARDVGMDVLVGPLRVVPAAWLATAAVMGLLLATLPWRWRTRSPQARRRLAVVAPRTLRQGLANVGLCLLAGVAEEIVYRGVLHGCLWWATGSWWLATAACSLSFGLAHAMQGARAMLIIAVVAVWMHLTVLWTGSLHLAMVAHAAYDLVATFAIARWMRREEAAAPAQA